MKARLSSTLISTMLLDSVTFPPRVDNVALHRVDGWAGASKGMLINTPWKSWRPGNLGSGHPPSESDINI